MGLEEHDLEGRVITLEYNTFYFSENFLLEKPEKELLILLYEYESVLINAATTLSPALVANYIFELAKEYNRFYQEIPIIKEENAQVRALRLKISEKCAEIIKSGMKLLGIDVPERM